MAININGSYSIYQHADVARASNPRFKMDDSNQNQAWVFELNGNIVDVRNHNFSFGSAFDLSEGDNSCDTLYAHFQNLRDCPRSCNGTDYAVYGNLICRWNTHSDYHFQKISNAEHYVKQPGGGGATCVN